MKPTDVTGKRTVANDAVTGLKTIWVFTPSRTDPKDLEFILVQRQHLIQDAVDRVRESALTDHKHHLLFVGPRGCGKTHLVTLIVSRLSQEENLADRLRIAWLNEDETCTTLLELLVKIHSALAKRYPTEYNEDDLNEAYDLKPDAALELVTKQLLSALGPRTLLVVAENLDALFDGLGELGQKKLRAFIQENPKLSIVATAQRLVEDLSSRASPFFGFFQTEHLKTLNVDEANELLQKIAQLQGKTSVVEFLATSRGRSRVRALHHLSGGNHRIYIVLSQFITRDSIDALLGPFMKMVDELTPYYQERIRWLPPLQRKIVEYLCSCEGTVSVKEIAKRLFASPQTISSQLQDLREKGYVEANPRGRESLYEISEPLMRICVEVKDNQRLQPLRLLVDFLRVWYDDTELKSRLDEMVLTSEPAAYFSSAVQRNSVEGNLRHQIILKELQMSLSDNVDLTQSDQLMLYLRELPEPAAFAMQLWAEGKSDEANRCLDELISEEVDKSRKERLLEQVAVLLFSRGDMHGQAGEIQREIGYYTAVITLAGAPVKVLAGALVTRGKAYSKVGQTDRAVDDYGEAIGLVDAPVWAVAEALLGRGTIYAEAGQTVRAIDDYGELIGLVGAPVEMVAAAFLSRGMTHSEAGQTERAINAYPEVVRLAGAPVFMVANALLLLGKTYDNLDQTERAVDTYTELIGLAGAPVDGVTEALVNRGVLFGKVGEKQRAIDDCTAVIELAGAPIEGVAMAFLNRGTVHHQANEIQLAIDDYTVVIGLADAPVEHVATALIKRGFTQLQQGRKPESQADFETLVGDPRFPLEPVVDAHLALAEIYFSEGRWDKGFQAVEASLTCGERTQPAYRESAHDLVGMVFSAGLNPEGRHDKVTELLRLYALHQALPVLGEAVVKHVGSVFRAGQPFPSSDNLEGWAAAWEQAALSLPDFSLSARLLRTGIDYVKAGGSDPGILLTLTATERVIVEQSLGLS
jgi:tetratricopeptide (TPR) repeat protein/DNA-binding transcriptional ArsR family regulator